LQLWFDESKGTLNQQPDGTKGAMAGHQLTDYKRGKPTHRPRLEEQKRAEQDNLCPICDELLPVRYVVLDRFRASDGYTQANIRLIHDECEVRVQAERGYARKPVHLLRERRC